MKLSKEEADKFYKEHVGFGIVEPYPIKLSKRAKRMEDGSIVIDEGDDYKMMAYKLEKPVNNRPVWQRLSKKQKQQGGKFKNTMISDLFGNPFKFVVVCYEHPNRGYFSEACFFWNSMYSRNWNFVPVVSWTKKYDRHHINVKSQKEGLPTSVSLFLKDYPEFRELFE